MKIYLDLLPNSLSLFIYIENLKKCISKSKELFDKGQKKHAENSLKELTRKILNDRALCTIMEAQSKYGKNIKSKLSDFKLSDYLNNIIIAPDFISIKELDNKRILIICNFDFYIIFELKTTNILSFFNFGSNESYFDDNLPLLNNITMHDNKLYIYNNAMEDREILFIKDIYNESKPYNLKLRFNNKIDRRKSYQDVPRQVCRLNHTQHLLISTPPHKFNPSCKFRYRIINYKGEVNLLKLINIPCNTQIHTKTKTKTKTPIQIFYRKKMANKFMFFKNNLVYIVNTKYSFAFKETEENNPPSKCDHCRNSYSEPHYHKHTFTFVAQHLNTKAIKCKEMRILSEQDQPAIISQLNNGKFLIFYKTGKNNKVYNSYEAAIGIYDLPTNTIIQKKYNINKEIYIDFINELPGGFIFGYDTSILLQDKTFYKHSKRPKNCIYYFGRSCKLTDIQPYPYNKFMRQKIHNKQERLNHLVNKNCLLTNNPLLTNYHFFKKDKHLSKKTHKGKYSSLRKNILDINCMIS